MKNRPEIGKRVRRESGFGAVSSVSLHDGQLWPSVSGGKVLNTAWSEYDGDTTFPLIGAPRTEFVVRRAGGPPDLPAGDVSLSSEGSITRLISHLKDGNRETSQQIWEVYFDRLFRLAHGRLRGTARSVADEEDVVVSVFDSFFRRAELGQFPQLQDRDDLWKLLFVLTVRKAINHIHHEGRQTRGGGRIRSLSDLEDLNPRELMCIEPSPELAAQMTEECQNLLDRLGDPTLRAVAVWKMEGHTNREIANKLECVEQTVERKLRSIRRIWSNEDSS